ncbi:MAG: phosphorylase [Burkholderiales bacterium]|nr:phosphorylase [Burkholderiales bacterium]MDR4517148.1 phosphorylase [Nitrosomonas sp.]
MPRIGVICALKAEAACLSKEQTALQETVQIGPNTWLCMSGIGGEAALTAARKLAGINVNGLISFGVAAALEDKLTPGDLILPKTIHKTDMHFPVTHEWRDRIIAKLAPGLRISGGALSDSAIALTSAQDKLKLGQLTGACAADMETAAIAEFAAQKEIPFIAVRAIVDPVAFSPPTALIGTVSADGTADIWKLLPLIFNGSISLKTLFHLAMGMRAACSTLKKTAALTGLDFGYALSGLDDVVGYNR